MCPGGRVGTEQFQQPRCSELYQDPPDDTRRHRSLPSQWKIGTRSGRKACLGSHSCCVVGQGFELADSKVKVLRRPHASSSLSPVICRVLQWGVRRVRGASALCAEPASQCWVRSEGAASPATPDFSEARLRLLGQPEVRPPCVVPATRCRRTGIMHPAPRRVRVGGWAGAPGGTCAAPGGVLTGARGGRTRPRRSG